MKVNSSTTIFLLTMFCMIFVSGCATNTGPVVGASDPENTQFRPHPDYAKVFFYRDSAGGASLTSLATVGQRSVRVEEDGKAMEVRINSELAGYTTIRTYFRFDLPAGHYVFNSQGRRTKLILDVENNEVYFIQQKDDVTRSGAGSRLTLVDKEKGVKGVALARYLPTTIEARLRAKNAKALSED